jgi:hypothetical protein
MSLQAWQVLGQVHPTRPVQAGQLRPIGTLSPKNRKTSETSSTSAFAAIADIANNFTIQFCTFARLHVCTFAIHRDIQFEKLG